jgi:DnaJ-class molecular chaperone
MICPTCHGERMVREEYLILPYNTHGVITAVVLCPECGGFGRVHCCEGLREQPEQANEYRRRRGANR